MIARGLLITIGVLLAVMVIRNDIRLQDLEETVEVFGEKLQVVIDRE